MEERTGEAVDALTSCLRHAGADPALRKMFGAKEHVLRRYGESFSPSRLAYLTADEFRSFLYLENNYHWSQLYRRGLAAADDMTALRDGLGVLLDETAPIRDRWNRCQVHGMGKALKSAILLVMYPDRFGVWNGTSERGLTRWGLMPIVSPKTDKGRLYEAVNRRLNELAAAVGTDLWMLDGLWWAMDTEKNPKLTDQFLRLP